jgi:hypothetical protein
MPRSARRTLRALSGRLDFSTSDASAALKELSDAPDRVAAIVAASLVEDSLRWALNSYFILNISEDEEKILFENSGILSTFHAKVLMGHALGLFGPVARGDLTTIKDIRNVFAHAPRRIDFTTPAISDACDELQYIDAVAKQTKRLILRTKPLINKMPRERFMATVKVMILDLHVAGGRGPEQEAYKEQLGGMP